MSYQRSLAHVRRLAYPPSLASLPGMQGQARRLDVTRAAPPLTYSELGAGLSGWNPNELRGGNSGFLVEDAGRNLALQARQMHIAPWLSTGWGGGCDVTGNTAAVLAPDGTQTVTKLFGSFPYSGGIGQPVATVAGQTYTFSAWLGGRVTLLARTVPDGGAGVQPVNTLHFDLPTNVLTRRSLTWTETVTGTRYVGGLINSGETGYLWGGQLEARAWPSSLIPTTAAAVDRDFDFVRLAGSPLPAEFTVLAGGTTQAANSIIWECKAPGAGFANVVQFGREGDAVHIYVAAGGAGQYDRYLSAANGGFAQVGLTYKAGRYRVACNGVLAASGQGVAPIGASQHEFGALSDGAWLGAAANGYLRPVLILPHAVSDADLAALTA